jgi:hypothetical protein
VKYNLNFIVMNEHELLWAMLPEGLEAYFVVKAFKKREQLFEIVLEEKNVIGELPEQYRGKKVINTVLRGLTMSDFPIRGRKTDIIIKRRYWKFEGVDKWYKKAISLCANGTQLDKEFADFLKEFDRVFPDSDLSRRYVDEDQLKKLRETVQEPPE